MNGVVSIGRFRARREITRTLWARVSASGATAFTAPVIVDRYGRDRGCSDPRSRDHEPRPSADQADGVMTDASGDMNAATTPIGRGRGGAGVTRVRLFPAVLRLRRRR